MCTSSGIHDGNLSVNSDNSSKGETAPEANPSHSLGNGRYCNAGFWREKRPALKKVDRSRTVPKTKELRFNFLLTPIARCVPVAEEG